MRALAVLAFAACVIGGYFVSVPLFGHKYETSAGGKHTEYDWWYLSKKWDWQLETQAYENSRDARPGGVPEPTRIYDFGRLLGWAYSIVSARNTLEIAAGSVIFALAGWAIFTVIALLYFGLAARK